MSLTGFASRSQHLRPGPRRVHSYPSRRLTPDLVGPWRRPGSPTSFSFRLVTTTFTGDRTNYPLHDPSKEPDCNGDRCHRRAPFGLRLFGSGPPGSSLRIWSEDFHDRVPARLGPLHLSDPLAGRSWIPHPSLPLYLSRRQARVPVAFGHPSRKVSLSFGRLRALFFLLALMYTGLGLCDFRPIKGLCIESRIDIENTRKSYGSFSLEETARVPPRVLVSP